MMKTKVLFVLGVVLMWSFGALPHASAEDGTGCTCGSASCAGHSDHADEAEHDDHAAHADEEAEGLRLTPEQRERFGIVVQKAGPGQLRNEVSLPGEVLFNEDRLVHLVPRAAGIAVEIHKTLGDTVKAGDTLARIDSADLASAKLDYFSAITEVGCCQFELPRAQAIHDNTLKMLALLESSPSVEALHESVAGQMGDYRSQLTSAYAEYGLTKSAYERERALMDKKITSQGDFLAAENAFKKAQAEYFGMRDSVAYEVKQQLLETTRDRRLAEFEAQTAEQKLHMLGLSESDIAALAVPPQTGGDVAPAHECTDPNCKDCQAVPQASSALNAIGDHSDRTNPGWYEIKAPFDGVIVQKHISLGERVGDDSDVFAVADTSTVWVNLTVYTKSLAAVRRGQDVVLRVDHSGTQARGKVAMVTPFVEESTRSATARVVLDNSDGRWIPGTFVTGFIGTSEANLGVVVARDAVQNVEGRDVVFIEHEGRFEMTPVTLGRSDRANIEITAGLTPGTPYVSGGAFQLKATAITSTLDSHAGHGH